MLAALRLSRKFAQNTAEPGESGPELRFVSKGIALLRAEHLPIFHYELHLFQCLDIV